MAKCKVRFCYDCHKKLSKRAYYHKSKRCKRCAGIHRRKKSKFCKECGKKLTGHSNPKRCNRCAMKKTMTLEKRKMISKRNTGKGNGQYKNGKWLKKKRYCKHCRRLLKTKYSKVKYCQLCANKIVARKRTIWHKHHLYLKLFKTDKIIIMKNTKHQSFHSKVYEYLLLTQGKIAIRRYLKWFIKRYGIN